MALFLEPIVQLSGVRSQREITGVSTGAILNIICYIVSPVVQGLYGHRLKKAIREGCALHTSLIFHSHYVHKSVNTKTVQYGRNLHYRKTYISKQTIWQTKYLDM